MLPSLHRLPQPTSTTADMSDVELRYTHKRTHKEANAFIAKRKHLDQMSEDALKRYMDYMESLDGTQTDYEAKIDALKAAWDAAKERWNEANKAVDDAIQRVVELREELHRRELSEL